jgi:FtsP/CotA-like multicopper oxidase with cupredoxin domain
MFMCERPIERGRGVRLLALLGLLMAPTCSVAAEQLEERAAPTMETMKTVETLPTVRTHGNTQRAGVLKNGTLTLNLRAGRGVWRPEKESGPALEIEALGEADGPLMAPAPLIRVPEGTEIVARVTNALEFAMRVHGLCERNGDPCAPIEVPAGSAREVRFKSGRAGTYGYWAETTTMPMGMRFGIDSQLSGAFVVDPAGGAVADDRIFVITIWTDLAREQLLKAAAADDPFTAALMQMKKGTTLMNGLSWPDTERFTFHVGDTVRWRFVNGSGEPHPLHLHGFYFDVDSAGDGVRDTQYAEGQKPRVVTQYLPIGGTTSLTWTPERPGNWLFHCHIIEHVEPARRLSSIAPAKPAAGTANAGGSGHGAHGAHGGHETLAGMAGMVLGVTVLDRSGTASDPIERPTSPARKMTLAMRTEPNRYGTRPAFGFALIESENDGKRTSAAPVAPVAAAAPAAPVKVTAPGPTLILKRDEPVEITLKNELGEPTAVHWHGMELESYYDGVHEWGGAGQQRTPLINPGESFVVKFTPPRAGTFMYHTHMHDDHQLSTGMYGAMLVMDPSETYDPETDHALVVGVDGIGSRASVVLNGSKQPVLPLRAGRKHRIRLANITRHDNVSIALRNRHDVITWRPLTKDGIAVPSNQAAPRKAEQLIGVGETYDFEYDAPAGREDLWIELRGTDGRFYLQGKVVVK